MIAAAIDKILELKRPETVIINGETFATHSLHRLNKEMRAEPIDLSTLDGLLEYIDTMRDEEMEHGSYFLNVVSPTRVELVSSLDADRKRETLVVVRANTPDITFGFFIENERMVIMLQSMFVDGPDKDLLMKFAGTVTAGSVTEYGDDGVTQKATIKHGIVSKAEAIVPSSVKLRPYRTFAEVEQPESSFIFRMKEGAEDTVNAALFEADGGAWKIKAIQNIGEYLEKKLGSKHVDIPVIA